MTLNKLIETLQAFKQQHGGDVEVMLVNPTYDCVEMLEGHINLGGAGVDHKECVLIGDPTDPDDEDDDEDTVWQSVDDDDWEDEDDYDDWEDLD